MNIFCKFVLLLTILSFSGDSIFAQEKISGKVTGNNDLGLPGVTVLIKGTKKATQTDTAGNYSIYANKGESLLFSFVGYVTREVKFEGSATINIVLSGQINNLNEVVVTGYVSEKVKDITGAVAIVKPKDLTAVPAGQVEPMLQGRVAGMTVITQALPGSPSLISIHGFGNFADVAPLYIIDGTPGKINDLNPDDIESLQVLKDAGAAAIYGVRGANGVIVVTTKKGKSGNPSVYFDNYFGWQEPLPHGYDMLDPQGIANTTWMAYRNTDQPLVHPQYSSASNTDLPVLPDYVLAGTNTGLKEGDPLVDPSRYNYDTLKGPIYQIVKANKQGTDWYHISYKPAFSQNYTLTVSGSNNKTSYLFSAGYLNQQGTLVYTYLKRFTVRVNTEFNLSNHIRIGENLQLSSRQGQNSNGFQSGSLGGSPLLPEFDIMGNRYYYDVPGLGFPSTPGSKEDADRNKNFNWTTLGNAFAEIDFAKYFTFRTNFGGTFNYKYSYYYIPVHLISGNAVPAPNRLHEEAGYDQNWSWQNILQFHHLFKDKHSLKVLLGSEYNSKYGRGLNGDRINFYSDDPNFSYLSNGSPQGIQNGSSAFSSSLYSLFTRIDYAFDDKYLFGFTLRRDGSSLFGTSNRYGFFPSVSFGWRMTQEKFAHDLPWLEELKLRGSWGQLGFDGNTPPNNQFTLFSVDPSLSYYAITGSNTTTNQGFRSSALGNPNTGWQKDEQTDIGLDVALWNSKLYFSADYFFKKSDGLLFPLAVPALLGGASAPFVNIGNIENKGFDLLLGSKGNLSRDFKFDVTVTLSLYRNRITKLNEGQTYFSSGVARNQVGHPISAFYGYEIIGFFNSEDEIAKSPVQADAKPGRFKYKNANNFISPTDPTQKIDDSDRTFFGDPNPKFSLGLNIAFSFRNFDFSTFFYGVFGNQLMNTARRGLDRGANQIALNESWTPDHHNAIAPILENINTFSNLGQPENSYGLEDGTYFRNKSMILGYSLPRALIQQFKIRQFRVYFQVTNLFTITSYSGLDPETIGNYPFIGIDYGNNPNNQKQWLFGFNIGFQ